MRAKIISLVLTGLAICLLPAATSGLAADAKKKVTYADDVSAIFRNRCGSCHNGDKQKGGLNLDSYGTALRGGGSGTVIEPGDPDGSTLLGLINQTDEPKMPPNSPKIPDAEIALIRQWIEGGALETSGSVATVKAKPKFEFKVDPSMLGKPAGPAAMPVDLLTEPFVPDAKPGAVVAAAGSTWAPLVAVGGHKQVLLYRTTDNHLMGVLPFPEGTIHTLRFSRNGDLLLAGGGRGGKMGLAVAWDVKNGKRVFEIGKEYDSVLAADISPDHSQVALGGPGKIVRVYNTADGSLMFEMKKHTDWITAAEFSPDGALLATGDRSNGLIAWEAQTGREFHDLRGHTLAITDISWRLDSNVFASSSEDGSVRLWEMENGGNIKTIAAHGGGVSSVRFTKSGGLITSGRDRFVRLWDANGAKQRDFEAFGDIALVGVVSSDESRAIGVDWTGEIRAWDAKDGRRVANLAVNPAPIVTRIDQNKHALAAAQAEAEALTKKVPPAQAAVNAAQAPLAKAGADFTAAEKANAQQAALLAQREAELKAKTAAAQDAAETSQTADQLAKQAHEAQAAAEKAIAETAAAEKAAADAIVAEKIALDKALTAKAAQDPALAATTAAVKAAATPDATAKAVAELTLQVKKAQELIAALAASGSAQVAAQNRLVQATAAKAAAPPALQAAQARAKALALGAQAAKSALDGATAAKAAGDKAVADARAAVQASTASLAAAKKTLDAANAAHAAAAKALADTQAAIQAAQAKTVSLKAEIEMLAIEKKRADAATGGLATNARPSP
jgi:hypothetical protein